MEQDITNLALSREASKVANTLKESIFFNDALSVAKFAMSYAIKYHRDELKSPTELKKLDDIYDTDGNNYNIGSVDPDNYIANLMRLLYSSTNTPYRYARVIMCYGLNKIGDLMDVGEGKLTSLYKNM